MIQRSSLLRSVFALFFVAFLFMEANAQSSVEQNSNVVGMTPAGYYRGIPAMQDNEPSCAINPILPRNIVCAWNGSGGSDDPNGIGDTWLRFSESIDGGRTFFNRYLNGSNLDQATSVGQQFGADPVMMCWPGGCGTVMLASTRGESGGIGGGIYMQMMVDLNNESGFRKAFKVNLDQVYRSTGSHFADKPHAIYILDEDNPGVVDVSMTVERVVENATGDGTTRITETIVRQWPKARIVVVFALFNSSKTDIEILSTYTDDYATWSNPKQIAVTSGRDQGVSLAAIGDTVFYGFRRFAEGSEPDAMMGVVVTRNGTRIGKPFQIGAEICEYDVPTLPTATNKSAAAARTNDFPWVSQNGSNFIMVYSERRRSSDGGCLSVPGEPSDSRIMAIVGSKDGLRWSDPVEVAPNPAHGFQFMPTVECSLGVCQIAWWDSRRDSLRTREYLQNGTAKQQEALTAFENLPIFADFQYSWTEGEDPAVRQVIQFKRTVDMFTKKFEIKGGKLVLTPDEPTLASRYRLGLYDGQLIEREVNPAHVKAYKSSTVPFTGDYNSLTSARHRFVFDPENPTRPSFWQDNASPNPLDPDADPLFWLSWTDGRNMRGQLYTSAIDGKPPYFRTDAPTMLTSANEIKTEDADPLSSGEPLAAASVEDSNPLAGTCEVTPLPPVADGVRYFPAINNRTKDADIYGALIENRVNAWSLNPTKTLGNILRTYTIVAENEDNVPRRFRFEIVNQPIGYPATARVSWDQLPFEITDPAFNDPGSDEWIAPDLEEFEDVGPNSSVTVALFLVSAAPINPVGIRIFDDATNELVNTITVNGSVESGPLLNADGSFNDFELHNPIVYAPDQFNPDQFNPDQYNPDQFNPDLYNPDQFNPDQFNPDQYNPDQYNPDQFNPDQFNPDQFNPDQFNPDQYNPDQYNPDQFNSTLTDAGTLHNPEIPQSDPVFAYDSNGENPVLVTQVVKLDVNYGIENDGNTLTPYSVDFALADEQVLAMIANKEIAVQLIAWQDKQVSDVQFCEPALITENRIIAAVNNPDLTKLYIPDIRNNRVGALTYFIAPGDILQNTLRFEGPEEKIQILADALKEDIISYVFASQAANTNGIVLDLGEEQVIRDRTRPKFNFPDGATSEFEATGPGGAVLPEGWVTASKDTETVIPVCTPDLGSTIALDIVSGKKTPLTCYATSDSNNVTATLEMFISVLDTQSPTITAGSGQEKDMLVDANVLNGAIINYSVPTATDIVDTDVSVICLPGSGSTFPLGATGTEVICTATDESGNKSATQTFTVTVEDTSPPGPLVGVPPSETLDAKVPGGRVVEWVPVTATDIADGPLTAGCRSIDDLTSGSTFPLGPTEVFCSATDRAGLSSTASFVITIEDQSPPDPLLNVPASETLEATSPTGAAFSWDPVTATDIVNGTIIAVCESVDELTSGSTFPIGATGTEVICTATDDAGLTSTDRFTVTVLDRTPPALPIYPDLSFQATSTDGTPVTWSELATDIVDVSVGVECEPASGHRFPIGTTGVSCSATDAALNSVSDTFNVTVVDTTVPVINDVEPPTGFVPDTPFPFQLAAGKNTLKIIWPISVTDADPGLSVTCEIKGETIYPDDDLDFDADQISATFTYAFPVGLTTVSCTATDSGGLDHTVEFEVNVLDVTPPSAPDVSALDFSNVEAEGPGGAVVTWPTLISDDAVDGPVEAICSTPSGSEFAFGTTIVSCTATDEAGNESTPPSTFDVTVVDTTPPTLNGISTTTIKVSADSSGTATLDIYKGITAADIADPAPSLVCGPNPPLPFGENTITCTATDASGNSVSDSYVINVIDDIGPIITLIGPESITLEAGIDTYTEQGATATDNVDGDVTADIAISGAVDTTTVGTYTIRYDVTDGQGQEAVTADRTVNVVDTIAPVITVLTNPIVVESEESPVAVDYASNVSVYDAGYPATTANCVPASGNLFDWGDTIVNCNATDAGGLAADSASFTVTARYLYDVNIILPKRSLQIGSTLPIDWQYLEWIDGSIVDSAGFDVGIKWSETQDCETSKPDGIKGEDSGSSNFRYSDSNGTWQYSLQTKELIESDYLIDISPPSASIPDALVCVTLR
jgi:hypothetical protein